MTNPMILLATFDETLAFTDPNGAGTWTGVDPIRYSALTNQDGLWVEEATTNMVPNPAFETNTTMWTAGSGGGSPSASIARVDTQSYSGSYSCQVTTGGGTGAQGLESVFNTSYIPISDATTYTVSCWAKGTASNGCYLQVITRSAAHGALEFFGSSGTTNIVFDGTWQHNSMTFTTNNASTNHAQVHVYEVGNTGIPYYVDAIQFEQKSHDTSAADGSLGDGYAWSGTAHASTSTRAASSATVDPTARIDASSGAIAFRYKRLIDTGAEEVILSCGVAGSGTDYLEIGVDANDDLYMEWNSDNAGAERVTIATTIAVDTDYFFYFDWDATTIRASIDNGSLSSDTRAAAEGDWSTGDLTLSAAVGSHVIGPFAVFDRPLEAAEITRLYNKASWGFNTLGSDGNRYNLFQLRPKAA